jgi:hypothetical protein
MKDLIHISDLVPKQFADRLQDVVYSNMFNWNYSTNTATNEQKFTDYLKTFSGVWNDVKDEGQLSTNIWHNSAPKETLQTKYLDLFSGLIFFMFDRVPESSIGQFQRVKANLNTKKPQSWENKIAEPHVDFKLPGYKSLLYYVDSADGETIIYNERYDDVISKDPKELTVREKFTARKGSAILFDSDIVHTHTYPIYEQNRSVINFCFSQDMKQDITQQEMMETSGEEDNQYDLFE